MALYEVQAPDGSVIEIDSPQPPTQEQVQAVMASLGGAPGPEAEPDIRPPVVRAMADAAETAVDWLPEIGGAAGGILGGIGGTAFGLGFGGIPGAAGGATLGASGGEAARQLLRPESPEQASPGAAFGGIAREGAVSGAATAAGAGVGYGVAKTATPILRFGRGALGTAAKQTSTGRIIAGGMKAVREGAEAAEKPLPKSVVARIEHQIARAAKEAESAASVAPGASQAAEGASQAAPKIPPKAPTRYQLAKALQDEEGISLGEAQRRVAEGARPKSMAPAAKAPTERISDDAANKARHEAMRRFQESPADEQVAFLKNLVDGMKAQKFSAGQIAETVKTETGYTLYRARKITDWILDPSKIK